LAGNRKRKKERKSENMIVRHGRVVREIGEGKKEERTEMRN
jgi:hypothetical protein